jgi:integrase
MPVRDLPGPGLAGHYCTRTAWGCLSTAALRTVPVPVGAYRRATTGPGERGGLNPCRIRGAGSETAPERPVLTVAQVFELAELVGRRPIGNIRQLAGGGYRLRFQRHGQMHTASEVYLSRPDAERALWAMTLDGRAECNHDRRFRALVLLATFASLRWGEVTALRRCEIDLEAGTVRVRATYTERSTGELGLGPPKSKASRRIVGVPRVIVPDLRHHLATFAEQGQAHSRSPEPRAAHCAGATSTALRLGRRPSPRSAQRACTSTT